MKCQIWVKYMTEPISVVITCYNLERYIGQAIRSVLEQDYEGEIQIIVVDDRSTDRSRDILSDTVGIETVLRKENGGVMRAMISGLRAVRHDMVFFLDGDDIWHREKLMHCMTQITSQTKLCTHDLWYMDSTGQTTVKESRVSEVLGQAEPSRRSALIEEGLLEHADYVWLGSALGVSRSRGAIDAFIEFCEKRDYLDTCYQDWPLALWVALESGGKMTFAEQKLFGYRLHAENYSGATQTPEKLRRNLRKSRDTFRLIEEIIAAKRGGAAATQNYRNVLMRYDLRLASTLPGRRRLAGQLLRAAPAIRADSNGMKIILRVGLVLLFGPERAHRLVERLKS
jgi:glycosyltransferase involved in cell wall biosynthesis